MDQFRSKPQSTGTTSKLLRWIGLGLGTALLLTLVLWGRAPMVSTPLSLAVGGIVGSVVAARLLAQRGPRVQGIIAVVLALVGAIGCWVVTLVALLFVYGFGP